MTNTEEANRPITLRWYDEWNSEGLPGFERVWAPDIVLHEAREFPESRARAAAWPSTRRSFS